MLSQIVRFSPVKYCSRAHDTRLPALLLIVLRRGPMVSLGLAGLTFLLGFVFFSWGKQVRTNAVYDGNY